MIKIWIKRNCYMCLFYMSSTLIMLCAFGEGLTCQNWQIVQFQQTSLKLAAKRNVKFRFVYSPHTKRYIHVHRIQRINAIFRIFYAFRLKLKQFLYL